ncbi:MAG: GGDEF domain-containing protein [Candidatus Omnitrophica bacterium]|nr:GGDEF domain-containing protein [Candidatus Omnitrophota bacterium]
MFEENWAYRIIVILSLCILLVWTYLTNENTLINYLGGKFVLDTRLIWQVGIFALLSVVLFYLMQSTLDYKAQNVVLKKYLQQLQQELDEERDALKDLKSDSSEELMRLESFIITISDMAKQISSVLETSELLKLLLRKTVDLLNSQKCAIFRVDKKRNTLVPLDSVGYDKTRIQNLTLATGEASGQIGCAAESGNLVVRKIMLEDPVRKHILDNDKIETVYAQPIVHESDTLAVICVGDASTELTSQQTARILSTLANFGSVALTNTILVDKIREQSRRDSLTWLYNHQFFQDMLGRLLGQAVADKYPLGLVILDIDHFKKLNDNYGHQAGDAVLKKAAEILNSESGASDITARYGGEEFVMILPHMDERGAYEIAEKIRKAFEETAFGFGGKVLKATVSLGVSGFDPAGGKRPEKNILIKQADDALYAAKEGGRNRTIVYKKA